jgi:integrase
VAPARSTRRASSRLSKHRAHRPYELGPALEQRGRWWAADLRPWGGGRVTLRNPAAPGWPAKGDRTEDRDIAERWKWAYVEPYRDATRRTQLGLPARAKMFGEQLEAYTYAREHSAQRVEPNTLRADSSALRVHLLPAITRATPTDEITLAQLQEIVDRLAATGYQPSSIRRIVHSWCAFFEYCGHKAERNVARAVIVPARIKSEARAWTDEELDRLRAAADRMDATPYNGWHCPLVSMRRALEFAIASGGRQSELLAAEEGAFRYRDRTVRFTVQINEDGTGTKPLKGKVARTTLMLPSWWDWHDVAARPTQRVLQWARGDAAHRMSTSYLWIQRLYDAAELNAPGLGWHTLRHTYARIFIESGGRFEELQKSLGHRSITTTEQTYGHFHEDVAARLARGRIYQDGGPELAREVRRRA